ncbi:hypothetical protein ACH4UR_25445 [Streptomyces lydicus]|uniref:hypothetical protein n=1 Tax=Streptomyces lydicus TaxID=47763 RepID=UPI0033DF70CF
METAALLQVEAVQQGCKKAADAAEQMRRPANRRPARPRLPRGAGASPCPAALAGNSRG